MIMEEDRLDEELEPWTEQEYRQAIDEFQRDIESTNISLTDEEVKALIDALKKLLAKLGVKTAYPYYPYYPYPEPKGEASIYESRELRQKYERIAESLRRCQPLKEQWIVPTVVGTHEITAHLRQYCTISKELEDKAGDTIHLPKVSDFDLGSWGSYGSPTLNDLTGTDLITFAEATVQECGAQFYLKRHLTEKADANVIELVNQVARRAVLRAEDKKILSDIYNPSGILELDKSGAGVDFDADWIAEIISEFQGAGVDVQPNDLVLVLCPEMYEALMKDVAGAMGLVFARPDVIQKGVITEFMGVTIKVVSKSILPNDESNVFAICFKKGSYVLAPKRDFLIETDPDPSNRRTLAVVSTACAGLLSNPKYAMKIKTQVSTS